MNSLKDIIENNEKVEGESTEIEIQQNAKHFFLVGDSTVSSFNDDIFIKRFGYGTKVQDFFDKDKITVINLALSGRSSRSFTTEKNYEVLCKNIKKGDFLLISFGHNDEKNDENRYTNPNGKIHDPTSFKFSLFNNYIKMAKDKGATPILCTPIVRRSSQNTYTGMFVHKTQSTEKFEGGDYGNTIRELAAETNTILIDALEITKDLYFSLGAEKNAAFHAQVTRDKETIDNTHLNEFGAKKIAQLLVTEICKNVPELDEMKI